MGLDRDALIVDNEGLIKFVLSRYFSERVREGVEEDDLIQAGYIGLIKAANSFDPTRGTFATYARHKIRAEIQTALENGEMVRRPHGRTDLPFVRVKRQGKANKLPGDDRPGREPDPADAVADQDNIEWLLRSLSERDKDMVIRKIVMGETYREIGKRYGLSDRRVSQIIKAALDELRKKSHRTLRRLN